MTTSQKIAEEKKSSLSNIFKQSSRHRLEISSAVEASAISYLPYSTNTKQHNSDISYNYYGIPHDITADSVILTAFFFTDVFWAGATAVDGYFFTPFRLFGLAQTNTDGNNATHDVLDFLHDTTLGYILPGVVYLAGTYIYIQQFVQERKLFDIGYVRDSINNQRKEAGLAPYEVIDRSFSNVAENTSSPKNLNTQQEKSEKDIANEEVNTAIARQKHADNLAKTNTMEGLFIRAFRRLKKHHLCSKTIGLNLFAYDKDTLNGDERDLLAKKCDGDAGYIFTPTQIIYFHQTPDGKKLSQLIEDKDKGDDENKQITEYLRQKLKIDNRKKMEKARSEAWKNATNEKKEQNELVIPICLSDNLTKEELWLINSTFNYPLEERDWTYYLWRPFAAIYNTWHSFTNWAGGYLSKADEYLEKNLGHFWTYSRAAISFTGYLIYYSLVAIQLYSLSYWLWWYGLAIYFGPDFFLKFTAQNYPALLFYGSFASFGLSILLGWLMLKYLIPWLAKKIWGVNLEKTYVWEAIASIGREFKNSDKLMLLSPKALWTNTIKLSFILSQWEGRRKHLADYVSFLQKKLSGIDPNILAPSLIYNINRKNKLGSGLPKVVRNILPTLSGKDGRLSFVQYTSWLTNFVNGFIFIAFTSWPICDFIGFLLPAFSEGTGFFIIQFISFTTAILYGFYCAYTGQLATNKEVASNKKLAEELEKENVSGEDLDNMIAAYYLKREKLIAANISLLGLNDDDEKAHLTILSKSNIYDPDSDPTGKELSNLQNETSFSSKVRLFLICSLIWIYRFGSGALLIRFILIPGNLASTFAFIFKSEFFHAAGAVFGAFTTPHVMAIALLVGFIWACFMVWRYLEQREIRIANDIAINSTPTLIEAKTRQLELLQKQCEILEFRCKELNKETPTNDESVDSKSKNDKTHKLSAKVDTDTFVKDEYELPETSVNRKATTLSTLPQNANRASLTSGEARGLIPPRAESKQFNQASIPEGKDDNYAEVKENYSTLDPLRSDNSFYAGNSIQNQQATENQSTDIKDLKKEYSWPERNDTYQWAHEIFPNNNKPKQTPEPSKKEEKDEKSIKKPIEQLLKENLSQTCQTVLSLSDETLRAARGESKNGSENSTNSTSSSSATPITNSQNVGNAPARPNADPQNQRNEHWFWQSWQLILHLIDEYAIQFAIILPMLAFAINMASFSITAFGFFTAFMLRKAWVTYNKARDEYAHSKKTWTDWWNYYAGPLLFSVAPSLLASLLSILMLGAYISLLSGTMPLVAVETLASSAMPFIFVAIIGAQLLNTIIKFIIINRFNSSIVKNSESREVNHNLEKVKSYPKFDFVFNLITCIFGAVLLSVEFGSGAFGLTAAIAALTTVFLLIYKSRNHRPQQANYATSAAETESNVISIEPTQAALKERLKNAEIENVWASNFVIGVLALTILMLWLTSKTTFLFSLGVAGAGSPLGILVACIFSLLLIAEFRKMGASRELALTEDKLDKRLFKGLRPELDNFIKFSINTLPSLIAGFLATVLAVAHFGMPGILFQSIASFAFLAPAGFTVALALVALGTIIQTINKWKNEDFHLQAGNYIMDSFYTLSICSISICAGVALLLSNPIGWFIAVGSIFTAILCKIYDHRHTYRFIDNDDSVVTKKGMQPLKMEDAMNTCRRPVDSSVADNVHPSPEPNSSTSCLSSSSALVSTQFIHGGNML